MKNIPVADVRNFAVLGHSGSGKTTLTEALAFKFGLIDRQGSVDTGNSVSDFSDEEKNRKISIFSTPFIAEYAAPDGKKYGINFIDTPGYMDFYDQVLGAIRATDAALIAIDAVSGVQVGSNRAWQTCRSENLKARGFVITGLDRENADFDKAVASIQEAFGSGCIPVMLPVGTDKVVDVLEAKEIPAEVAGKAEEIKAALIEQAASTDDALIEKFLEGEELSPGEISKALVGAVATGELYPIFVALPLKGVGIDEMLQGICRLFPSPEQRGFVDNEGEIIPSDPAAPFVGMVFRTAIDTFVGQLNYVRVISGTLKAQTELLNTTTNSREVVGSMLSIVGRKQTPISEAGPGDIVALPKLKDTHTGQALVAAAKSVTLPEFKLPQPVHFVAISAETQADEDRMGVALSRITEQFSAIQIDRDAETKQVVMKGMGDVHIDVAVSLMKSQSNTSVKTSVPKVAYRETVTAQAEGHHRHRKQSGGRGQFGEVYLRAMPRAEDEEEWFYDMIVGGAIPGNFLPAVQKGVSEGMEAGAVAGYPVQNVKVEIYDGSYHDVDSSEVAFKIAGSRAFRDAMAKAKPVLLEPIMTVKITIPDRFMGAVSGDLNHRRGRMLGMNMEDGLQTITAEIPMAELFQYSAQLRSLTGGQGVFQMEMARYDIVPTQITQKVAAESAKDRVDQDDD